MMESGEESIEDVIKPEDIPFMQYGIINKHNYTNIHDVPVKRWDPLSFNPIILNQAGYNITLGKKYGHYSYISPIRGTRPRERKNLKDLQQNEQVIDNLTGLLDIFEPMIAGKHFINKETGNVYPAHTIVISNDKEEMDDPFTDCVRVYPNLHGKAFSMINKFPALVRTVDPEILPKINQELKQIDTHSKLAKGVCFLTVPKCYHETVEDMTSEELEGFFQSTQNAIKYVIRKAKESYHSPIIPISPFFNVGREVGGSLRRLHMQCYMDLTQDGHGSRLESVLRAFDHMNKSGSCHICNSNHEDGKRTIINTEDWTVFATGSPIRNYHLRFAPKEHIEHFGQIKPRYFKSLSKILTVTSMVLNDLGINPSRNIIFNTRPYGYNSFFHIYGDILPFELIGGAEMTDDMRVVRISPQKFAKDCREIIKIRKYKDLL